MEDLVERQAAIDALRMDISIIPYAKAREYVRAAIETIYNRLENLLPAQTEQKVGKWIKMSDADGMYYCCSECGEELYRNWTYNRDFDLFPKKESIDKTNYCPNCGSFNGGE